MIKIDGSYWLEGYAFSQHVLSSVYLGDDEYGRARFDTEYSKMADYYRTIKYRNDKSKLDDVITLLKTDGDFIAFVDKFDIIVTIPPTKKDRSFQPVFMVAEAIARKFKKNVDFNFLSSNNDKQIKNASTEEKTAILKNCISISNSLDKNAKICIFDDIYSSGTTLNYCASVLYKNGYKNIYAFTLTKTKNGK